MGKVMKQIWRWLAPDRAGRGSRAGTRSGGACMHWSQRCRVSAEEYRCDKYKLMLLLLKIRLRDVPECIRLSEDYAKPIHITAFRADRRVSKDRYLEDLLFFEVELLMMPECELKKWLEELYAEMKRNLKLFDIYKISDFH